jgi:hypothetical protein
VPERKDQRAQTDRADWVRDSSASMPSRSQKRADTLTMKKNLSRLATQPSLADLSR